MGTHRTRQGLGNTLLLVVQLAERCGDRADDLATVRARKRRRPEVKHTPAPARRVDAPCCTTGRMPAQAAAARSSTIVGAGSVDRPATPAARNVCFSDRPATPGHGF